MIEPDSRLSCFYPTATLSERVACTGARTVFYTALTLLAFAGNSFLCRAALGSNSIDAASFTEIRIVSGAVALWLLTARTHRNTNRKAQGNWKLAAMLFSYAVTFSFAYKSLNTGTGALILFGSVQATMFAAAIAAGERPGLPVYVGLSIALAGLTYLVLPGLESPSPLGALLMAVAGMSWGVYSLLGRGASNPTTVTRGNFLRAAVLVLPMMVFFYPFAHISPRGMLLAVISGGIASAVGYILWYTALQSLSAVQASLVQLIVPVLAAAGGVIFLSEVLTFRLVMSAIFILGGIAFAIVFPVGVSRSSATKP